MKILIIGSGQYKIYESALKKGFKELNMDIEIFYWQKYFKNHIYSNSLEKFYYKVQNKFLIGPVLWKINSDIVKKVKKTKPDLVFIYRGTHIYPQTIQKIKQSSCKVFGYNNDDPFSDKYKGYEWKHYKASIPFYDWIFAYRWKNIDDYKAIDYKNVSLLRSYYIKENNFNISDIKKKYDVVFIGHWEDDNRDEMIKYLIDNNIDMKLFGTSWEKSKYYSFFIKKIGVIKAVYGSNYNKTINKSKIALVFLSKLNNDTYTRRCFEIPATKTMMLSEYTNDLANNLYQEGKEAEYFRSKEELLKKLQYYLTNKNQIIKIGENGYKRLVKDGHEVVDRCREIIRVYNENFN